MTKREFMLMKKAGILLWTALAVTGREKPNDYYHLFKNGCPACEVASDKGAVICESCPIDIWRLNMKKTPYLYTTLFPCTIQGAEYNNWVNAITYEGKKVAAENIACHTWTFLPEHKKVILSDPIKDFLKTLPNVQVRVVKTFKEKNNGRRNKEKNV